MCSPAVTRVPHNRFETSRCQTRSARNEAWAVRRPRISKRHNLFQRAGPMKRTLFAVFALVFGAAGSIQAQNPGQAKPTTPLPTANGEVLGAVVDTANKEPVARASIAIRSKKDSSFVTGVIAGPEGTFPIQGLRPGDYYLRTTSIGFKPRSYTFSITDAAPRANVGSLSLTRIAVTLQSVQVAGQAPTMVIEPDRTSYGDTECAP